MAMMADDPDHLDLFLLTDSEKGNSYKFQAGNRLNAMLWFKHLNAACQSNRQQVPANLSDLSSIFIMDLSQLYSMSDPQGLVSNESIYM